MSGSLLGGRLVLGEEVVDVPEGATVDEVIGAVRQQSSWRAELRGGLLVLIPPERGTASTVTIGRIAKKIERRR
jgi:hypothetical protein